MKSYRIPLFSLVLSFPLGCGSSGVRVPVVHPAELDLSGRRAVSTGAIEGPGSAEYEAHLRQALSASPYLQLAGPRDPTTGVLVSGRILEHGYSESTETQDKTCTRKEGTRTIRYKCRSYTRRGVARARVSFEVTDRSTSRSLGSRVYDCERKRSTFGAAGPAAAIDRASLLAACVDEIVDRFMRTVAPWEEQVVLPFQTASELPGLEDGVKRAHGGDWEGAAETFAAAISVSQEAGMKPEVQAKAHVDHALALAVQRRYEAALAELAQAEALYPNPEWAQVRQTITSMKADSERVAEQTGDLRAEDVASGAETAAE